VHDPAGEHLTPRSPIQVLPEGVANRIAAGEVVERPASVVKELVENALDAGAGAVDVAVEAGGAALIRVADDGHGIAAEELPLAVSRHCTSKLADAAGLSAISTMGFRGEALPSIGAVARLSLVSRHAGADAAWRIAVEGGRVGPVEPAARGTGTTVEVRDLFFATPARLKFLKSERTETAAVADTVKRLALSAPHVAVTLNVGGRTLRWGAGTRRSRSRPSATASASPAISGCRRTGAPLPPTFTPS
jgi:DNA mismatch repair protein MutL